MKTEIRIINKSSIDLLNHNFTNYAENWSGTSVYSTTLPSLIDVSGDTTYNIPTGWTYLNGYVKSDSGSTNFIFQDISGQTFVAGIVYKLTFDVIGIKATGDTAYLTPYFLGTAGTSVYENGTYEQYFNYTGSTSTYVEFRPTADFVGYISNINITSVNYNYEVLDLYNEEEFNLTLQIQTDITKRSSSYSKTINIPGTSNNCKIFDNLFNISSYNNPATEIFFNKKVDAGIYQDTLEVMLGYVELTSSKTLIDGSIEFSITFYSNNKNIADKIGDKLIVGNANKNDDLNFSKYDHIFNKSNILATHQTDKSYKLITQEEPFQQWSTLNYSYSASTGVFYPFINYAGENEGNTMYMEFLKPALYVKEIWDEIFKKNGFSYTSNFLNSSYFKNLIIPMTNEINKDEYEIDPVYFNVGMNNDFSGTGSTGPYGYGGLYSQTKSYSVWSKNHKIKIDKDTPLPYFNDGVFSTSLYEFKAPYAGTFNFNVSFWMEFYISVVKGTIPAFSPGEYLTTSNNRIEVDVDLIKKNALDGNIELLYTSSGWQATLKPYLTQTFPLLLTSGMTATGSTIINPSLNFTAEDCSLVKDDVVYLEVRIKNNIIVKDTSLLVTQFYNTGAWGIVKAIDFSFSNDYTPIQNFIEGNKVHCNNILPRDFKQIDFVKNIFNLFNLQVAEDRANGNNLIIEPFGDFYYLTGSTFVDWTNNLDISKEIIIERIPDLINKQLNLDYTQDDKDDYNKKYKDNYNLIYGNQTIYNPYLSNETTEIKNTFSPTIISPYGTTNWQLSTIVNNEDKKSALDDGIKFWNSAFKTKILYRNVITGSTTLVIDKLRFASFSNTGTSVMMGTGTLYDYIPYAGPIDNPYNPIYDLSYGVNKMYYHEYTTLPYWNLYRKYWKQLISLYMDVNSKKLTCYLWLKPSDIYSLDFRKRYLIDGSYYIVRKISEWNPYKPTKVELYKLSTYDLQEPVYELDYIPYKTTKSNTNVINIEKTKKVYYDSDDFSGVTNGNVFGRGSKGIIFGDNNLLNSTNFLIKGDYNEVYSEDNTLIDSNYNKVYSTKNIVIGSDNNLIEYTSDVISGTTQDNTIIINSKNNTINSDGLIISSSGITVKSGTTNNIIMNSYDITVDTSNNVYIKGKEFDTKADTSYVDNNFVLTGATWRNTIDLQSGSTITMWGNEIYIKSPNGHRWRLDITDGGSITYTDVDAP